HLAADAHLYGPRGGVPAMTDRVAELEPPPTPSAAARRWLGSLALAVLAFGFILPILWMTTTSFQSGEKMFQLTTEWIPLVWHPENYPNAWSRAAFATYFF